MSGEDDRRVHAVVGAMDVVRYDRAGKWYLEPHDPSLPRQAVNIDAAVNYIAWGVEQYGRSGVRVVLGRMGGTAFDRKVKARGLAA